jgi:hypothetical protein
VAGPTRRETWTRTGGRRCGWRTCLQARHPRSVRNLLAERVRASSSKSMNRTGRGASRPRTCPPKGSGASCGSGRSSRLSTATSKWARGSGSCCRLAGDGGCRPLALLVTPGRWDDAPQMIPVLQRIRVPRTGEGRPRTTPERLSPDTAYSSRRNRRHL